MHVVMRSHPNIEVALHTVFVIRMRSRNFINRKVLTFVSSHPDQDWATPP